MIKPHPKPSRNFKLKESNITHQILDMLNALPGVFAYKHWGGPMGKKGVHDIICCFRGRFVSIEVKSPNLAKAKYSPDQEKFAWRVKHAEGVCMCVQSCEEVVKRLNLSVKLFPLFQGKGGENGRTKRLSATRKPDKTRSR